MWCPTRFRFRAAFGALLFALTFGIAADSPATLPPPVPGFPIGRCVRVIGVTAPEDAKAAGFEYVELALQDMLPLSDLEFAQTSRRIRALGIPAISGYGFLPAELKIAGPAVNQASVDEHLRRGLRRAAQLGLDMVVLGNLNGQSRSVPPDFPREEARRQLVDFGRRAAKEAKKQDITVLIEPMPERSTNMINTVAEALELVRDVDHPAFQMLIDFSYMSAGQEDMAILHRAAKHIRQVEISNPNGRVYPRDAGEADYASFFRALKRGGYRGGFSIHGRPADFFADAPRAIALLREMLRQPAAAR